MYIVYSMHFAILHAVIYNYDTKQLKFVCMDFYLTTSAIFGLILTMPPVPKLMTRYARKRL